MTDTSAPLSPVALSVVECVRKHYHEPTPLTLEDRNTVAEACGVTLSYGKRLAVIADLAVRLEAAERENERLKGELAARSGSSNGTGLSESSRSYPKSGSGTGCGTDSGQGGM